MNEPREPFYFLTLTFADGRQLLSVTGKRDSVIEAALMCITDGALDWRESQGWPSPHFRINCTKIK